MRSGFNSSLCVAGSISVSDCLEKRTLEISGEDVQVENKCVCESALTDVTKGTTGACFWFHPLSNTCS